YNNYEDTINCIESVEKYNTAPIKLIVIDNGSPRQGCVKALDKYLVNRYDSRYTRINDNAQITWPYLNYVTMLTSPVNDGYACGNNKGLKLADNDPEITNVMILNNDILFISDILPGLLKRKKTLPDCAVISPLLLKRDKKEPDIFCARREAVMSQIIKTNFLHYWRRIRGKSDSDAEINRFILLDSDIYNNDIIEIDLPSGSCMLLEKSYFKSIGWFDPHTFLYCEEDILHKKIKATGKCNYLDMTLRCVHLGAGSTQNVPGLTLLKAGMVSQRHYVLNYSDSSWGTKAIFCISQRFYWWSMKLQKRLTKH
ncbi:MAG: glycosyltransferase, partial [Muribaculaceae bacterium]|nr:glycosyltransferase [Muribaculaceae bacterium]